jgi:hypothetical protein
MSPDIERTIFHYYPQRALVSPLENESIRWDYDADYSTLKAVLRELEVLDPQLRSGTRGRYDISEEIVLFDSLRLQLSYIGPYAALDYGLERELGEAERDRRRAVERVLTGHGLSVLGQGDLDEQVPWIQHGTPTGIATVWDCLFVHPEA